MLTPDPDTRDGQAHWVAEIVRRARIEEERLGLADATVSKRLFKNPRRLAELKADVATNLRRSTIEQALDALDALEKEEPRKSAKEKANGKETGRTLEA